LREDIAAGRLVRLLEAYEAYDRVAYAVCPHSRHLPAKLCTFLDDLIDHCAPALINDACITGPALRVFSCAVPADKSG
jgi:DNA-binding transcriptional LysR family regulator